MFFSKLLHNPNLLTFGTYVFTHYVCRDLVEVFIYLSRHSIQLPNYYLFGSKQSLFKYPWSLDILHKPTSNLSTLGAYVFAYYVRSDFVELFIYLPRHSTQ